MASLSQDLRYSLRQIRKHRTFSIVAVLTLALGIGANTAMFSVIYGVLLRPLPYRDPGRVVLVSERADKFPLLSASWQNFSDWRTQNHVFEELGAVRPFSMSITGNGDPEQVPSQMVTGNLFHLLGVSTYLGRTLNQADDTPASSPATLISYGLWLRRFNGSESVLGQPITLNNRAYTIVGVLQRDYELGQQQPDAIIAMGPWASTLPDDRSWHPGIYPIGRLKQGVSLEQARSEMSTIAKRLLAEHAVDNIALDAVVNPMQSQLVSDARPVLMMLFGAVVFVLLIACGNVANLLLTRATARQREMSIRVAMGATSGRIVRQLLTEGVLLSVLGAAAGIALAYAAMASIVKGAANTIPGIAHASLDVHVLAFTAGLAILAGIFFGLAPALHTRMRDLRTVLNETDRGAVGKHTKGIRGALVISEVALAMLLLVGAGLFLKSFARLSSVNPGFSVEHILAADVPVSPTAYAKPADRLNFFDASLDRLRSVPGVHATGATSFLPASGQGALLHFNIEGRPPQSPSDYIMAGYRVVSAGYLPVMNIPLIQGRWITEADRENSRPVVVINRAMANTFFRNESPIGKRLQVGATPDKDVPWMEVVGIVGDVRQTLASDPATEMYVPFRQADAVLPVYALTFVVRSEGDPQLLANDLRTAIHQVNPNQPVIKIRTMQDSLAASIAQPRFRTVLLAVFALVALLIAAVGIYGVMAYATTQRTRELGIRLALGSSKEHIFQLVLGDGMRLTVAGVLIGAIGAWGLTRYVKSLLFSVSTTDALTLLIATLLVLTVGVTASYLPARRASRVEVSEILREN